ncbi:AGE family epimerase/isomerase [Phreatobacter sp. AB_2022a]|uniref:AGE family epimerase/isomerase n=1 Tax=Phreatobacter sp. AB_2022a TaxID=3003134 RepID=UPI0022871DC5|nr:AGE family epimerase/isomerase [Phreatobacter sp. AB_2022a]MCZ0738384.1 AGE family epimerase/isomerase [Phreatobacter sp. AB_2022a]
MISQILPLWSERGFLARAELFCEQMTFRGRPKLDVPYRSMVQARQIFVFTDSARLGLFRGGEEKALRALDRFLTFYAEDRDLAKGLAFSIDRSGRVVSPARDSYTHAFALFALASAYRLAPDARIASHALALLSFIDNHLWDPDNGGLFDCASGPSALKLQNPLMHLLEACLAAHEAWPGGPFLTRAGTIVDLFRAKLFQPAERLLFERYAVDWSPLAAGNYFEPGHHFEWIWLLDRYDRSAGSNHDDLAQGLWITAMREGVASDFFCFDKVGVGSEISERSGRTWPHTEAVRAALTRLARGQGDAAAALAGFLATINRAFLDPAYPGGWIDRVDASLNPASNMMPASTLYHLYGAFRDIEIAEAMAGPRSRIPFIPQHVAAS